MKTFFNFTKGEQRGIVILLLLIVVILSLNIFISNRPEPPIDSKNVTIWEQEVKEFEQNRQKIYFQYDSIQKAQQSAAFQNRYSNEAFSYNKPKPTPQYFFFDPNTATLDDFKRLGFSQKQAEAIERYRNRGVVFKEKEDFSKMFVVSEELFSKLEPWIVIQIVPEPENSAPTTQPVQTDFLMLELNSCDTIQLKKLKGIGSVLSQKIINYRSKLGGYYSLHQLLEINGINQNLLDEISPHLTIDITTIKKINLNKVSFKQLLQHPYFEYHIVKNIFNYKDKNGAFYSVEQLKEVPLVYEDLYNKLYPYIFIDK